MKILRAGIDSLYLAFQGRLLPPAVERLARAKDEAIRSRQSVNIELGGLSVSVSASGLIGGYPLSFDTGAVGEIWGYRPSYTNCDWSFFVKPRAATLLAFGAGHAVRHILEKFDTMGVRVGLHSLNRIDYAIDIRADNFELDLYRFVAPPRSSKIPYWSKRTESADPYVPSAVLRGRRLESVTIGRLPGRQLIVYDKTAEVGKTGNRIWPAAWQIDPRTSSAIIWRVEARAGKAELKERHNIRTLAQLETEFRPLLCDVFHRVRYIADQQSDTNISRKLLHPIWNLAVNHIETATLISDAGELPEERILQITREMKVDEYMRQILGNAAGLAAALDLSEIALYADLPNRLRDAVARAAAPRDGSFRESYRRARKRMPLKSSVRGTSVAV